MGDYPGARIAYDKVFASATNSRDRFHVQFQKALISFWEGQPEQGLKSLDSLLVQARRQKDPYAQFEIGFGRAQLTTDSAAELEQLRTLEASLQKPVIGMSEPDRNISLASVLREEARIASASGNSDSAQEAIAKLERSAAITRDLIVENNYESARGYALVAQGDLANASDELATDPHSPLALQQLALTQEKLGNAAAAESIRARLKYQRAPTVEWYLTTHATSGPAATTPAQ
jgi:tetratricopeptide (TPR) repeat protein